MLESLPIILNIVLLNGMLVVSPQDGATTIAVMTVVLNSLCNILTIVVLNGLLVSLKWTTSASKSGA